MCSTSVSLLIFYGLLKINWHVKVSFSLITIKAYYSPGKNVLFPKTEIRKLRKTADTTKT